MYCIVFIFLHIKYFLRTLFFQCKILIKKTHLKRLVAASVQIQFVHLIETFSIIQFLSLFLKILTFFASFTYTGNRFHWLVALYLKEFFAMSPLAFDSGPSFMRWLTLCFLMNLSFKYVSPWVRRTMQAVQSVLGRSS